uniref:Uncharacterized protein n=1 Tax=Triticum urartu TaxID=4572 RepID=A0A8R7U810_TRIUA
MARRRSGVCLSAGPGADEGPDVGEHLLRARLGQVAVVEHLEGVPHAAVRRLLHALAGLAQRPAQLQVPVAQDVRLRDAHQHGRQRQGLQPGRAAGQRVAPGVVAPGARRERHAPVAVRGGEAQRRPRWLRHALLRRRAGLPAEEGLDQYGPLH